MKTVVWRSIRYTLALVALIFATYAVAQVDYSNLSWNHNFSSYIVVLLGVTGCFNLVFFDIYKVVKRKRE